MALDRNTGRMTGYTFNMGSYSDVGQLIWNKNGSLQSLQITDTIPSTTDTQACNYTHDDLSRISSVACTNGSTAKWNQSFTYDAFGNIQKATSGPGIAFNPTYDVTKNWINTLPGTTPTTDLNGQTTFDGAHSYAWDAEGKMRSFDSTTITHDALGRMVETYNGSVYTQLVYGPQGQFAVMNAQTLVKALVPLPGGGIAVYTGASLNTTAKIAYYRHADHLGSSRLATTPAQTIYSSTAYAPFGEPYAQSGATDVSFTGQEQITASGMYDFLFRKYVPAQGRWLSPDPAGLAAVNMSNPQSWNRYAYVMNQPMSLVDPIGLVPPCTDDPTDGITCFQTQGSAPCPDGSVSDGDNHCNDIWYVSAQLPGNITGLQEQKILEWLRTHLNTFTPRAPVAANNGRNCTVGGASKLQYAEATAEVALMTMDFFLGTGPAQFTFGPDSAVSQVMTQSAQFQDVLTAYAHGQTSDWENFGAAGYTNAGGNPVAQFLGSFGWSASPTSGGVNFTLRNVTSFHSLMADHGPAYERFSSLPPGGIDAFPLGGPTPMGNVSQTITIGVVCH